MQQNYFMLNCISFDVKKCNFKLVRTNVRLLKENLKYVLLQRF
jgi:hypothetical protein